jgi:hypothetical protein
MESEEGEDFYEVFDDEPVQAWAPGRFSFLTPAILLLELVAEVLQATADFFSGLKMALWSHDSWRDERRQFTAEAGAELEKITKES